MTYGGYVCLTTGVQPAPLLTAEEFAQAAGVTPTTVYRWAREGLVRTIRLPGGSVRFRQEDVEAVLTPKEATS